MECDHLVNFVLYVLLPAYDVSAGLDQDLMKSYECPRPVECIRILLGLLDKKRIRMDAIVRLIHDLVHYHRITQERVFARGQTVCFNYDDEKFVDDTERAVFIHAIKSGDSILFADALENCRNFATILSVTQYAFRRGTLEMIHGLASRMNTRYTFANDHQSHADATVMNAFFEHVSKVVKKVNRKRNIDMVRCLYGVSCRTDDYNICFSDAWVAFSRSPMISRILAPPPV